MRCTRRFLRSLSLEFLLYWGFCRVIIILGEVRQFSDLASLTVWKVFGWVLFYRKFIVKIIYTIV